MRLIPVYAGSTVALCLDDPSTSAHPRLRGEHLGAIFEALATSGSSPSTRGAPYTQSMGKDGSRLIPVYAGSTGACRAG